MHIVTPRCARVPDHTHPQPIIPPQALTVDTKDVQLRLYRLLIEPELLENPLLLATALDCLEHLCKKSRSALLPARSASITRRFGDALCRVCRGVWTILCRVAGGYGTPLVQLD